LFYLQSLVLLVARRAAGDTLENRSPASLPFSTTKRDARGSSVGDLVDSMIEGRVVFEKIKVLESRIRYQIEKLVRIADDASKNVADGESYSFALIDTH
jgi:U3 small nucleolar ribonucleoprotein protein LCP5